MEKTQINMKPDMYFITKEFPYEHGEDSFVKPEYPYLCEKFNVLVIAAEIAKDGKELQEEGIRACSISMSQGLWDKVISLLQFLCEKDCYTEMAAIIRSRQMILKRICRALMFGTAAETFYRRLKKKIGLNSSTNALFYFYWFDYKCFGLTMHKHKFPNIKIVARTHGYDLYDYRELYGRQFFKSQMDAKLDRLVFAAQFAKDYYLERYQKPDNGKYPLHRLGVEDKNISVDVRKNKYKKDFLLLSCSSVVNIKRIDYIIEGLSTITNTRIRWTHIGGGDMLLALQEMARQKLGDNIQFEFLGNLENAEVLEFYRNHYVSCFITTTSTEGGSPVSVQEALSFGVPVLATEIGELSLMVERNGVLLNDNPTQEEIGTAIEYMVKIYGTEEYFSMCEQSLRIFKNKFDAVQNFDSIVKELEQVIA